MFFNRLFMALIRLKQAQFIHTYVQNLRLGKKMHIFQLHVVDLRHVKDP